METVGFFRFSLHYHKNEWRPLSVFGASTNLLSCAFLETPCSRNTVTDGNGLFETQLQMAIQEFYLRPSNSGQRFSALASLSIVSVAHPTNEFDR